MKLQELLSGIQHTSASDISKIDFDVKRIISNSQDTQKGDIFVAIRGERFDGHDFLNYVASKEVEAAVVERAVLTKENFLQIKVNDTRRALSILAKNFYKDPSKNIKIIGITGTNGKTTTSYLLENIFKTAGLKVGLIGTITYKIGERSIDAERTTPDPLLLNKLLDEMVNESFSHCIIEVSSHGLEQGRVEDIKFKGAVFMNLSHEHLDYHKTLENYLKAKLKLFENLDRNSYAVINKDSPYFDDIICQINIDSLTTYGIEENSDVVAKNLKMSLSGSTFNIYTPKGVFDVETALIGKYNIYNILAASTVAVNEEIPLGTIKKGIESFGVVPGRMECIDCGQDFSVFVDYAHTEDALKSVLSTLRQLSDNKIILVFGCGGDRDKAKRPKMGRVAADLADFTIITSDNPRSENPKTIAKEIEEGFKGISSRYAIILDRFKAIKRALMAAENNMIVLIAGKGHEKSQIFKNEIIEFDDREVVRKILKSL